VLAKQQANWTSCNHSTFEEQVGNHLHEHIAVDLAIRTMLPSPVKKSSPLNILTSGTRFHIVNGNSDARGDTGPCLLVEPNKKTGATDQMTLFNPKVFGFLEETLIDFVLDNQIICFTEHKRNGSIFRAHPSYHSTLPWHDWAVFEWELTDPTTGAVLPGKQWVPGQTYCFVDLRDISSDQHTPVGVTEDGEEMTVAPPVTPGLCAIVNSLISDLHHDKSHMFNLGNRDMEDDGSMSLRLVDVNAIQDTCFVVENTGNEEEAEVIIADARDTWDDNFFTLSLTVSFIQY